MLTPPDLATAYAVALAAERAREPAPGYRIYYMARDSRSATQRDEGGGLGASPHHGARFGSFDVPAERSAFVVIGRHAMCDVVLDGDPSIALRHLLVRATRLDDGCPRLSVLDLQTNLGFELEGGRHEQSIAVTGPLAFTVGAFAIIALPGGEALPDVLPKPVCMHALVPHPYRDAPVSSVTILPPAKDISETRDRQSGLVVSLRSARASAAVRLSMLDLEHGVLLGRAPKCTDALRTVLNDGISRVHLLLRKNVAYDLASTQGTYVPNGGGGWRRVRSVPLEPGAEMVIGSVNGVRMTVLSD